jgi:hypothetical protein
MIRDPNEVLDLYFRQCSVNVTLAISPSWRRRWPMTGRTR